MDKSIKRALYLLGYRRDAAGIARYLSKRGLLHCNLGALGNCPVANYLVAETGAYGAEVGYATATITFASRRDDSVFSDTNGERVPDWSKAKDADLPNVVQAFVNAFDAKAFVDLEN